MGTSNVKGHSRSTKGKGNTRVKQHSRNNSNNIRVVVPKLAEQPQPAMPMRSPDNRRHESYSYDTDERGITVHFSKSYSKTFTDVSDIPENLRSKLNL